MQTFKKLAIATTLLSIISASPAFADNLINDADGIPIAYSLTYKWVGAGITTSGPVARIGAGEVLGANNKLVWGAGGEANLFQIHNHTLFMPNLVARVSTQSTYPIVFTPHLGYASATGATGGVDVLIPLNFDMGAGKPALRAGFTQFQKDVSGTKHTVEVSFQYGFF